MRLRDRIRIELAVQRVAWWLDWGDMPTRQRRETTRELRANLAAAAAAGELDQALVRLGRPREMARAYRQGQPDSVRWRVGVAAAVLAGVAVTFVLFGFMIGFVEGAQAVGPEAGRTYEAGQSLTFGSAPAVSFQPEGDSFSATAALLTWPHVAAALLAFIVVARPWRALRSRDREPQPA